MSTQQEGSKAYLISIVMVAVLGGLLFGYDTAVISGAEKGLQAFFKEAKDFTYTDGWHGFTSSSALIGCIIGSALSGFLASNLGRKRSLILAGILFFISALGSMDPEFLFFEHGNPTFSLLIMFNIYRVIGGIGVGLASAICPMYIGEVAPSNIRGMLVSWNQFAIIFGQLVVYFVNFFILGDHIQPLVEEMGKGLAAIDPRAQWTVTTGWRYMFGSEAVPAGLFALLICFVPETPRYLVMIGQDNKALSVLSKINGGERARQILQNIKETITVKTEKLFTYGVMCIFIGIMLSVFQQAVGINAVLYYAPRIFGDMGMEDSIMVYSASFMFSWGPITWVLIAEIFPNTIRGAAVAIAVAFQWIFNFIVSSTFVPMFNMHLTEGDDFGHWFTYGLYGIICIIAAVFVWKLVPETKGKTLEDMSKLWKERNK